MNRGPFQSEINNILMDKFMFENRQARRIDHVSALCKLCKLRFLIMVLTPMLQKVKKNYHWSVNSLTVVCNKYFCNYDLDRKFSFTI